MMPITALESFRARRRAACLLVSAMVLGVAACGGHTRPAVRPTPAALALPHAVIPMPASIDLSMTQNLVLDSTTAVYVAADASPEVQAIGRYLATLLAQPTGTEPRRLAAADSLPARAIRLQLDATRTALGLEGYELTITPSGATITAAQPNGLFYGVQTVRQLLPWSVEHPAALGRRLTMRTGRVVDTPRLEWRGAMLDVSRHFLRADDVKRYIDEMALYKMNRLHLHLADDQGWRIEIKSWPNLTRVGGSSQVGGASGGFYTQAEFSDLVAYAASRYVTIVPEIDMPSHTNAALASYAALNCNRVAPPVYTGIRVGFSVLCIDRDTVYTFIDDVVREIGALTPSPWFHIGGDEVKLLNHDQYRQFVERVQGIVHARGKIMIGWSEVAPTSLLPTTIVQHWIPDSAAMHVARGGKVILSPGSKAYLDMKYDSTTVLGLRWAGLINVQQAYSLDPAAADPGVPESAVLGVEAPLWSETLVKREDFEYLAFPRLTAIAEVGWSPQRTHDWSDFRLRLAAHGPRLAALGVNFFRTDEIPWMK